MNLSVLKLSLVNHKMTLVGDEIFSAKSYLLGLLGVTFYESFAVGFDPESKTMRSVSGGIPLTQILILADRDEFFFEFSWFVVSMPKSWSCTKLFISLNNVLMKERQNDLFCFLSDDHLSSWFIH